MENAKKLYREHIGQEPTNLIPAGRNTAKNMAEVLSRLYGGNFTTDSGLKMMRFCTATKDAAAKYSFRIVDIHKEGKNHYSGLEIDTHQLPSEMLEHVEKLKVGESVTFYHEAHNMHELTNMTRHDLTSVQPNKSAKHLDVMSHAHITEKFLFENPFKPYGNDKEGYLIGLTVLNQYGIHARPAALIVKAASKAEYDCDVYLKKSATERVSAKSIMGIMILEAIQNSKIVGEAKGSGAKPCLEEIAGLFQSGFGKMDD